MICPVNSFADDLLSEVGSESELISGLTASADSESENSANYIGLVADMIDVVLAQSADLSLDSVQAETMAVQFLREAIPNIERDARVFGILTTIESARTTSELAFAAGQLRLLAKAISAPHRAE